MKNAYYIGLMSGTSMDGVDAVLVDFSGAQPQLIASHTEAIPVLFAQRPTAPLFTQHR